MVNRIASGLVRMGQMTRSIDRLCTMQLSSIIH